MPTLSIGVDRIFEPVCLSVCLSVFFVCLSALRSITQKRMIPKCSNFVQGYTRSDVVWG